MNSERGFEELTSELLLPDERLHPRLIKEIHEYATREWHRLGRADTVFFVVGNYDDATKPRLKLVRDELRNSRERHEAFLLSEIDPESEALRNFYVKFYVFMVRSDYVVGVFEDNDGGHELEIGETPLSKTFVLKYEYRAADGSLDVDEERTHYDAMLAMLFRVLDRQDRLFVWTDESELGDAVGELLERVEAGG